MLANSNPIGVIVAAFLFGAMNAGSAVLQMMTNVGKYLVQVLQFLIVLILAAQFSLSWWRRQSAGVVVQGEPSAKGEADEAAGPA